MDTYRLHGAYDAAQQPVAQGVNALFSDFGGNCRPLDLDFAAEDLVLGGGGFDPQQEAWQRNAALTNLAAQGAAIHGMVTAGTGGTLQPAWKTWSPSDDPKMDMDQSSGESFPSTSAATPAQTVRMAPGGSHGWQLGEPQANVKAESSNNPLPPTAEHRLSARQAAQLERERERAEKLKEKNKRAQRKFRQRQKDRQETAEKMAMDLAEQLQKMRVEKDALESRNRILERALGDQAGNSAVRDEKPADQHEPTFTPANGWNVFDPMGGLVLVATCSPPRKLTHRQMLSLSLRDMAKLLIELTRRLKECLTALDMQSPNPTAEARIQALLWERHAIMAYMAVNKPMFVYQVLSSKMVDPPETEFKPPPPTLWAKALSSVSMTEEQKRNVMEARAIYIKKIGRTLIERQEIRKKIQELEVIPPAIGSFVVATTHLQWVQLVTQLKKNVDLSHRCHSYFMARVWYRDVARFITEAHPFPVDIFAIIKELVRMEGAPTYLDLLRQEYGAEKVSQATVPLDAYVEQWPAQLCPEDTLAAYEEQQKSHDDAPDTELAKFSNRVPDDSAVAS